MTQATFDVIAGVASIVGVLVSIVGFIFTILQVGKVNTAARAAKEAAEDVRRNMIRLSTVTECSQALSIMDELRKLHRLDTTVQHLPERYSTLKRLLV